MLESRHGKVQTFFKRLFADYLRKVINLLTRLRKRLSYHPLSDSWDFFSSATTRGPYDLRQFLGLNEPDYRFSVGFSQENARSYFLYAALDEVSKTSVTIGRWAEFLDAPEDDDPRDSFGHVKRVVLESVLDEQDFRRRRLLEVLIDLLCFRTTNEQGYYRDLMQLQDLQDTISVKEDFREFYGFNNEVLRSQIDEKSLQIHQTEDTIELRRCWYRKDTKRLGGNPKPGGLLTSIRQRLKIALAQADAHEKLVLGLSYQAYSRASSGVHFQTSRSRPSNWLEQAGRGVSEIGNLALACLVSVQRLLGISPDGLNKDIRNVLEGKEVRQIFSSAVSSPAKIGDFVLIHNRYLAEVVEKCANPFGYESFQVRFLDEDPPWGIVEDWLPPQEVRRLYALDNLISATRSDLEKNGVSPDSLSAELLSSLVKQAMIEIWKSGLRDAVVKGGARQEDPTAESE
ncbi:MAG: hypothetical protein ABJC13_16965 [Acidobacteriota bacterium]